MFDATRRRLVLSVLTLVGCDLPSPARAQQETLRLATSERIFDVGAFRASGSGQKPAVLVMGGAKGYGAPAYARLAAALNGAGIDVVLIGYIAEGDAVAMRSAASSHARIAHYSRRMADWAATIPATMEALRKGPHPPTRFGLLGISLGAMPALTASLDGGGVSALAIVDGSLPDAALDGVRSLPPLLEVWGGADSVFPIATGAKLDALARHRGGFSRFVTYPGQGHAFFVEDSADAARARTTIVDFFAARL